MATVVLSADVELKRVFLVAILDKDSNLPIHWYLRPKIESINLI